MNKENRGVYSSNYNANKVYKTYDKNVIHKSDNESKTPSGKPLRYTQDSFTKELIGKKIRITLVNGSITEGELQELGMYDIQIKSLQNNLIILKSAIMVVQVIQ